MSSKLNDTQLTILTNAAARDNHRVLPLPALRAPSVAVQKTIKSLLADKLIEATPAGPDDERWDNSNTTLVVTTAGLSAIGISDQTDVSGNKRPTRGRTTSRGAKTAKKPPRARTGSTKQDVVIELLRRQHGATIEEMMAATGWQAHSVRGFMSGALKKRLQLEVVSEKDAKSDERRYFVAALKSK